MVGNRVNHGFVPDCTSITFINQYIPTLINQYVHAITQEENIPENQSAPEKSLQEEWEEFVKLRNDLAKTEALKNKFSVDLLKKAKEFGFSDIQLGKFLNKTEEELRQLRKESGVVPGFNLVDTCAAEFKAFTPYYYSTYDK